MNKKQHNNIFHLGSIVFFLLFFFFLSNEHGNNVSRGNNSYQSEIVINTFFYSSKATITEEIQVPSYHNNLISSFDKICLILSNEKSKLIAFNSTIARRIDYLKNKQLLIKPGNYLKFFKKVFPQDLDADPILS